MKEEWLAFEWPNVYFYQIIVPAEAWMFDFPKYSSGLTKMATTQARGTSCIYVIRSEYEKAGEEFLRSLLESKLERVDAHSQTYFLANFRLIPS